MMRLPDDSVRWADDQVPSPCSSVGSFRCRVDCQSSSAVLASEYVASWSGQVISSTCGVSAVARHPHHGPWTIAWLTNLFAWSHRLVAWLSRHLACSPRPLEWWCEHVPSADCHVGSSAALVLSSPVQIFSTLSEVDSSAFELNCPSG
jgi:hypothetical protein